MFTLACTPLESHLFGARAPVPRWFLLHVDADARDGTGLCATRRSMVIGRATVSTGDALNKTRSEPFFEVRKGDMFLSSSILFQRADGHYSTQECIDTINAS